MEYDTSIDQKNILCVLFMFGEARKFIEVNLLCSNPLFVLFGDLFEIVASLVNAIKDVFKFMWQNGLRICG